MVQNVWEKLQKTQVENSNVIRERIEAAVRRFYGINLEENIRDGVLLQ